MGARGHERPAVACDMGVGDSRSAFLADPNGVLASAGQRAADQHGIRGWSAYPDGRPEVAREVASLDRGLHVVDRYRRPMRTVVADSCRTNRETLHPPA